MKMDDDWGTPTPVEWDFIMVLHGFISGMIWYQ